MGLGASRPPAMGSGSSPLRHQYCHRDPPQHHVGLVQWQRQGRLRRRLHLVQP